MTQKEGLENMKKTLSLLLALTVVCSLAMLTFAQEKKGKGKESATASQTGKAHEKNAKKKGATEGKKKGQQGLAPGEKPQ